MNPGMQKRRREGKEGSSKNPRPSQKMPGSTIRGTKKTIPDQKGKNSKKAIPKKAKAGS